MRSGSIGPQQAPRPAIARRRRVGAWGALGFGVVGLALLLAVAQLVLPRIAAKALRDRVAKYGDVRSAGVAALPAVQLLWGSADSARLTMSRISLTGEELVKLLVEGRSVDDVIARSSEVKLLDPGFGASAVSLRDAELRKHGDAVSIGAVLSGGALRQALPAGMQASIVGSEGDGVLVRVSGELFGLPASLEGRVQARSGKLVLIPIRPAIAGLARITLFADPHFEVLGVSAAAAGEGWSLRLRARLR